MNWAQNKAPLTLVWSPRLRAPASWIYIHQVFVSGPRRFDGPRCKDLTRQMEDQLVLLTGARDRRGGGVITFPQNIKRDKARAEDYIKLLEYFTSLPR